MNKINSTDIIRQLNIYFRGIFFMPAEFSGGLHESDIRLPFDKEAMKPYFRDDKSLDLKKMAGKLPFSFFFPKNKRNETDTYWADISCRVKSSKVIGGVIRLIIEDDLDDAFINRLKEQAPQLKIERNEEFSIPRDFFDNLVNNRIYVFYDDDDKRGGDEMYLQWDFTKMKPAVAHIWKDREMRVSIYNTFEWYAERQYTALFHGFCIVKETYTLQELIKRGEAFCIDRIAESYFEKHPEINKINESLFTIIIEILESPHGKMKTIKELEGMVFGELDFRKGKPQGGPLSRKDIRNINSIANDVRLFLSEKEKKTLDLAIQSSKRNAAFLLYQHLSGSLKEVKMPDYEEMKETIRIICLKIELEASIKSGMDETAELPGKNIFLDSEDIERTEYYMTMCLEGFSRAFDWENKEKDFFLFIQNNSCQELDNLLFPYTTSNINEKDPLFCKYCSIMKMSSLNKKTLKIEFSLFKTKIENIIASIKEKGNKNKNNYREDNP